jgi:hypothetical protein
MGVTEPESETYSKLLKREEKRDEDASDIRGHERA